MSYYPVRSMRRRVMRLAASICVYVYIHFLTTGHVLILTTVGLIQLHHFLGQWLHLL